MKDMSIAELSALTASDSPAPGGGSIAALAGSFAAALAGMVANLTIGRSGYDDTAMHEMLDKSEVLRAQLLDAVEKDAMSFDAYITAAAMPRGTENEKATRQEAMQLALKTASAVPFMTAEASYSVLELAEIAVRDGNKSAVTDGLVAALMARAALKGALCNVRINLASINDVEYVAGMREKCAELQSMALSAESRISGLVPELL